MGKKTISESKSSASTSSEDNRIVAENESVVLAKGSSLNINNEFTSDVADAFDSLINLAGDALKGAQDFGEDALDNVTKSADNAVESVSKNVQQTNLGQTSILSDLAPTVVYGIVAIIGLNLFLKKG